MVPVRLRGALRHPGASVSVQGAAVRVAGGKVLEASTHRALPWGHEGARVVLRYHPHRAGVEPFHQRHGLDRPASSAERSSGTKCSRFRDFGVCILLRPRVCILFCFFGKRRLRDCFGEKGGNFSVFFRVCVCVCAFILFLFYFIRFLSHFPGKLSSAMNSACMFRLGCEVSSQHILMEHIDVSLLLGYLAVCMAFAGIASRRRNRIYQT